MVSSVLFYFEGNWSSGNKRANLVLHKSHWCCRGQLLQLQLERIKIRSLVLSETKRGEDARWPFWEWRKEMLQNKKDIKQLPYAYSPSHCKKWNWDRLKWPIAELDSIKIHRVDKDIWADFWRVKAFTLVELLQTIWTDTNRCTQTFFLQLNVAKPQQSGSELNCHR